MELPKNPLVKYLSKPTQIQLTNQQECSICLDTFSNPEEVFSLTCSHCFHSDCILSWLVVKNQCALCKSEVYKYPVYKIVKNTSYINSSIKWKLTNDSILFKCSKKPTLLSDLGIKYCNLELSNYLITKKHKRNIHGKLMVFLIYKHLNNYSEIIANQIQMHFELSTQDKELIRKLCHFYRSNNSAKYKKTLQLGISRGLFFFAQEFGKLLLEEKNYEEGIKYLKKAFDNEYYWSGIELARYYHKVENDSEKAEWFLLEIINKCNNKLTKEIASFQLIQIFQSIKNYSEAEKIIPTLNLENLRHVTIAIRHYYLTKNKEFHDKYYQLGIKLFESKYKFNVVEPKDEFNQMIKDQLAGVKNKLTILTYEKNFPTGFYLYVQAKNSKPYWNEDLSENHKKLLKRFNDNIQKKLQPNVQ